MIRYAQILFSVVVLAVLAYLGLTWAAHKIGFCMSQGACTGPFYDARHTLPAIMMAVVLLLILFWPAMWLSERWKNDVELEEGRIQERKKQKVIEEFSSRGR